MLIPTGGAVKVVAPVAANLEVEESSSSDNIKAVGDDVPSIHQHTDDIELAATVSHPSVSHEELIMSGEDVTTETASEHIVKEEPRALAQHEQSVKELESWMDNCQLQSGEKEDAQVVTMTKDTASSQPETKEMDEQILGDQTVAQDDPQDNEASSYPALDQDDDDESEFGEVIVEEEQRPESLGGWESDGVMEHKEMLVESGKHKEPSAVATDNYVGSNQASNKTKQEPLVSEVSLISN